LETTIRLRLATTGSGAEIITSTGKKLDALGTQGKRAGQSVASGMEEARASVARLVSAGALVAGGGYALKLADEYNLLTARMRLAAGEGANVAQVQEDLFRTAQDSRADLSATVDLYTRLAPAIREYGGSQQDAIAVTEAVGKSLKLSGADAAASTSAILQFGQALASGKLQGDEFRAVMEASPRLAQALADGLGVARGELKEMSSQGVLTAETVVQALLSQRDVLAREFQELPPTIGDSLTQIRNEVSKLLGGMDGATGVTSGLASGLSTVADNLDVVAAGVGVLASVLIGRGVAASAAYTAEKWAEIRAEHEAAAAKARGAAALREHAAMLLADAKAAAANATGMQRLAMVQQQVVPARQNLDRLTASAASAAAGVRAIGVAGRALAFLGGPVGAVVTAIGAASTAAALFAGSSREASAGTRDWREETYRLRGELKELDRYETQKKISEMKERVAELQAQLRSAPGMWEVITGGGGARKDAEIELGNLRRALSAANDRLSDLDQQQKKTTTSTDELTKADGRLLDRLLPLRAAYRDYYADLKTLNAAYARGAIGADEYAEALFNLNAGLERSIEKADSAGDSHSRFAGSVKSAVVGISEEAKAVTAATEGALSSGENAWVEFATTGKTSMEDLANAVAREIARMQYAALAAQASSGLLNSFFGGIQNGFNFGTASTYSTNVGSEQTAMLAQQDAGLFHTGGVAGASTTQRTLPAAVWAGAPRYHSGGVAGLSPDEVPAILLRGERVLSREESAAYGAGASVTILQTFHFHGANPNDEARMSAWAAEVERRTRAAIINEMNRRGPAARASGRSR